MFPPFTANLLNIPPMSRHHSLDVGVSASVSKKNTRPSDLKNQSGRATAGESTMKRGLSAKYGVKTSMCGYIFRFGVPNSFFLRISNEMNLVLTLWVTINPHRSHFSQYFNFLSSLLTLQK